MNVDYSDNGKEDSGNGKEDNLDVYANGTV